MKILAISLGALLTLHVIATMWTQWAHEQEMKEVMNYIERSTRIQREICRFITSTALEQAQCAQ